MKKGVFAKWVLLLSFLFLAGVLGYFLSNDFWQDEVYTLYHFVFVPLQTTLTDYHSTNNHVLFSLLCNGVRNILGIQELSDVLLHPFYMRCIPVFLSLLTVLIFYKKTANRYGKTAAAICSSVWVTTFPLLCFASQLRGYSLSILIVTLQYFSFANVIQSGKMSIRRWLLLFLLTSLSLLCLPTNIYIEATYLLLCALLFALPSLSSLFFTAAVNRTHLVKISIAIIAACLWTSLYYRWMLQQQPSNELIITFHPFAVANLLQSLSIFYHFYGYRLYLVLPLVFLLISFLRRVRKEELTYHPVLLPVFLFSIPFLFFFLHGAIIIQRTFLSLVPFFALLTGLAFQSLSGFRCYPVLYNAVMLLNLICISVRMASFINTSQENNVTENHQQDLVQHYYLVHFNALAATQLAKLLVQTKQTSLYLSDGFGQTGIDYYLNAFHVPFTRYTDSTTLPTDCLILTNLKKETVGRLNREHKNYQQLLLPDQQYTIFRCSRNANLKTL